MAYVKFLFSVSKVVDYDSDKWLSNIDYRISIIEKEQLMIKPYLDILKKYRIQYTTCDTVPGSFSLNRDWVETEIFPATISWGYVRPLEWSDEDFNVFYNAEREGRLIIQVRIFDEKGNFLYYNQ